VPKFLRVTLASDEEEELRRRLRRTLGPWERLRLECVRLSHRGWTVPEVAAHLEVHQATVREALRRFADGGFDALPDGHRSGRPPTLTADVLAAVEALLDAAAKCGEAWTVPRLVDWLEQEHRVAISAGRLGVVLNARGFRWKRTKRTVQHKADPTLQERAKGDLEVLRF
jgi:transposase